MGFAALNTGNNLLYLVVGMMLSMIGISGILSELSIRALEVERRPPERPVVGRVARGALILRNPRRWLPAVAVWVEEEPVDQMAATPRFFVLTPAGEARRLGAAYRFDRRGVHRLRGVRIRTTYPFGFFHRSYRLSLEDEVLVYPPVEPVARLPVGVRSDRGEHETLLRGRGGDFLGLREYTPGDDPRRIHWRSSAKRGQTLVREETRQHRRRALIKLELTNPLPEESAYEKGIVLLVSHATHLLSSGYQVAVDMPGVTVPFDGGAVQRQRSVRAAALAPR